MHKMIRILAAALAVAAFGLTSCASAPEAKDAKAGSSPETAKEPAWVANSRSVYPESQYVSATGYGPDRETAEKDALGQLISIFGQTVKGETTVSTRYTEAVKNGQIDVSEDSSLDRAVNSSFDLETVVGAEVKDTWTNGETYYAVAAMDKAKASITYANLIDSNERTISKLVAIPEAEQNTLDAYARYDLASTIAETNGRFLNVLSVLSPGQAAAKRSSVSNGDEIRVQCMKIAQAIPIGISVEGDRDGRIAAAFASVVANSGFKSGGLKSRYVLTANMSLSEVQLNDNKNKFTRYILDSKLTDTKTGTVLIPYSANGREGHSTLSEAENRAFRAAEKKIGEEYSNAFSGYIFQLSAK